MRAASRIQIFNGKIHIELLLALLWVALMFQYIYNDIFSIYQPGHIEQLLSGHLEGLHFSQKLLVGAALLMVLPSLMVLLSLILKAPINRSVNIAGGVFQILVLIGTQFVGEGQTWLYWRLFEIFELIFLLTIIWTAWKWPKTEIK